MSKRDCKTGNYIIKCIICGREVETNRSTRKYCSEACRCSQYHPIKAKMQVIDGKKVVTPAPHQPKRWHVVTKKTIYLHPYNADIDARKNHIREMLAYLETHLNHKFADKETVVEGLIKNWNQTVLIAQDDKNKVQLVLDTIKTGEETSICGIKYTPANQVANIVYSKFS